MSITVIMGPMFSGKTSELIRLIDRKRIAGKKCLIIKHTKDNRFDNASNIVTHSEIIYSKCPIIYLSTLEESAINLVNDNGYDVVGIDEGFFFSKVLKPFFNKLADSGIDVIVSTLESSFRQELFLDVGMLCATAEHVIKLKAICMRCKELEASFTIRTIDSTELILVGGADEYQSVCRPCLNKFKSNA